VHGRRGTTYDVKRRLIRCMEGRILLEKEDRAISTSRGRGRRHDIKRSMAARRRDMNMCMSCGVGVGVGGYTHCVEGCGGLAVMQLA
jgi:hypothetical protein